MWDGNDLKTNNEEKQMLTIGELTLKLIQRGDTIDQLVKRVGELEEEVKRLNALWDEEMVSATDLKHLRGDK
jgi:hypothetical protein